MIGPLEAARAAALAWEGGAPVAIVTLLPDTAEDDDGAPTSPASPGARLIIEAEGRRGTLGDAALDAAAEEAARAVLQETEPRTVEVAGARLFIETHRPMDQLVIAGAGHIAVPLARVGAMLGFRVLVLDDREELTGPERFPAEAVVRRADFADAFGDVPIGPWSYVVLVTRAHRYDFDCLRQLLRADASPAYIGMIGSRRRVRAAFGALLEAGTPRERLALVRAPVGLDVGAETPEEIAISIAAELVAVRRGVDAPGALSERERVLERLLPDASAASA